MPPSNSTASPLTTFPRLSSQLLNWSPLSLQYYQRSVCPQPELHPHHHIIVLYLGHPVRIEAQLDQLTFSGEAPPDNLLIAPAHAHRHIHWQQGADFALLRIAADDLAHMATRITPFDHTRLLPQAPLADPLLAQIGRLLKAEVERQTSGVHFYVQHLMNAFLAHLIHHYTRCATLGEDLARNRFRQILTYIDQHLEQPLTLEALARVAGISPYHFARQFKQAVGLPPRQYIIRQRIEKTKQLLRQSQLSIMDVALQCGFNNQSHLSLHFNKFLGMTPRAYRQVQQATCFENWD